MRIADVRALPATPWKNKGGVTREIAAQIDGERLVWRLSVADVETDGPFSIFPGASRVLTVIEGAGLRLAHAGGVIAAAPGRPVRFSGDVAIDCTLVAGSVRDFNLIFDPSRVKADVTRLEPGVRAVKNFTDAFGILAVGAPLTVEGFGTLAPETFLFLEEDGRDARLVVPANGFALMIEIA